MITRIRIKNYRSFVDAEVKLRSFSLVVGANGSGKSNLLRFLSLLEDAPGEDPLLGQTYPIIFEPKRLWTFHTNHPIDNIGFEVDLISTAGQNYTIEAHSEFPEEKLFLSDVFPWEEASIPWFTLNPEAISSPELIISKATVGADGSGTAQVLESLKSGDREDLFLKIEKSFRQYVPEIEKLSLRTVDEGKKQIQVRERGLNELLPATELSEGTRLILCILTIIHQERPPPIILLEDIDRGLHPRLFEYMAPLMKDIAERHNINILATTHNPYLVDCFKDDKEAVIIVEKKDGVSTLSTLADRLEGLDYDSVDPDDMPLGNLWFSGLVGGVPAKITRRPEK